MISRDAFNNKTDEYLKEDSLYEILILPTNLLEKELYRFTDSYLSFFSKAYDEFDRKFVQKSDTDSFDAYKMRAHSFLTICQNSYVIPITNELNKRNNELLQKKAIASIEQGKMLLGNGDKLLNKANESARKAKKTFIIALCLSIASFVVSFSSLLFTLSRDKAREEIQFQESVNLKEIQQNIVSIKKNYTLFFNQYLNLQKSLDSLILVSNKADQSNL